jgi:hypothetical protein
VPDCLERLKFDKLLKNAQNSQDLPFLKSCIIAQLNLLLNQLDPARISLAIYYHLTIAPKPVFKPIEKRVVNIFFIILLLLEISNLILTFRLFIKFNK